MKKHFPMPVAVTWTIEKTMRFVHSLPNSDAPPEGAFSVPQAKTGSLTSGLVVTDVLVLNGVLVEKRPVRRSEAVTVSDTVALRAAAARTEPTRGDTTVIAGWPQLTSGSGSRSTFQ